MLQRGGSLAFETGGGAGPLLVLLHGLAATARVWDRLLATARWPGRWIAPDLPGHGASAATGLYRLGEMAASVGELITGQADGGVIIIGHSLGGALALALAGHATLPIERVYSLGIKLAWSDDELARFAAIAARSPRYFPDEPAARQQHARQCGLEVAAGFGLLDRGVVETAEGWRTAVDPAAFAVERPPIAKFLAAARCPVHLACGSADPMVTIAQMRAFDADAEVIEGAGHNAMVEAPAAVWAWIDRFAAPALKQMESQQ